MPEEAIVRLGVIILAAGNSSRMGQPKMLLPWGETTVLGHLLNLWSRLGAIQIAVVHQSGENAVVAELDRTNFPTHNRVLNLEPDRGMFSSIQCAAQWTGWQVGLTHWAIVLGDQPHLGLPTLNALLKFGGKHPHNICQPGRHGRGRHPVLLPGKIFKDPALVSALNLKDFLHARTSEVRFLELDDPALDLDIDRPEDYEQAVRLYLKRQA